MKNVWTRMGTGGRVGLVVGVALIVLLVASLGYWALGKTFQPLFADLAEQDAATLVAELDRMKVPYRLEAGGQRIMVPEDMVPKTRLQLVSKNLPLHGSVGFEIFNNTDFGMTEFNQRVNYQRALQGELTRTILTLEEVQSARVHLVLPESTLFKREQNKPKASVTLSVRAGQTLGREEVLGIQRLVAAAVPGIQVSDVTVLDQKGSTLSRLHDAGNDVGGWQLQTKREIEELLASKARAVLDRAYGPGQGLVSVDVVLNFDQAKTTTEEMLGVRTGQDTLPSGVVVRERQTMRDAPAGSGDADDEEAAEATVTQSDVEYQPGRRVEQIVASPGSVRRISVAVVLPKGVSAERAERVRGLVMTAVGLDTKRGDAVVVHSLDQLSDGTATLTPANVIPDDPPPTRVEIPAPSRSVAADGESIRPAVLALLLGAVLLVLFVLWQRSRSTKATVVEVAPRPLAEADRQALLENLQRWLVPAETPRRDGPAA
jgi:flagellar M-ring protein FliF